MKQIDYYKKYGTLYGYWRRTFDPSNPKDRRAFRNVVRNARIDEDGWATFYVLPLGDEGQRCPQGVDIYTAYGWNNLRPCIDAFNRGETIWMESDE